MKCVLSVRGVFGTIGTNAKSEMNSCRDNASGCFSHLRLLMPVGYGKG